MKKIPYSFDWRTQYKLSAVRNQGKCGTCWAIAIVTCFQDNIKIISSGGISINIDMKVFTEEMKTGKGDTCTGGSLMIPTFQKMLDKGCLQTDGKRCFPRAVLLLTDETIEEVIYTNGPVIALMKVYICEGKISLYNYEKGIYGKGWWDTVDFSSYEYELHSVVIVGWGVEKNVPYWIIRNSWGSEFGEGGYFKMIRGHNFCCVEEKLFTFLI